MNRCIEREGAKFRTWVDLVQVRKCWETHGTGTKCARYPGPGPPPCVLYCVHMIHYNVIIVAQGQRRTHVTHMPLALYTYTTCTTPGTRGGPWQHRARASRRSAQIDARLKTGASVKIPWTYLDIFRGVHVPPVPPMGYAPATRTAPPPPRRTVMRCVTVMCTRQVQSMQGVVQIYNSLIQRRSIRGLQACSADQIRYKCAATLTAWGDRAERARCTRYVELRRLH